jgi:hypothetical protein
MFRTSRSIAALLLVGTLGACSDSTAPLLPFQPQINSTRDNFQLQATEVTGVSATQTWSWSNTGTRATINHSTTTSVGTARVIIKDAAGAVVYDKALLPSLNEPTAAGAAGTWKVQVTLSSYSGTLNFRAQKL